MAPLHSKEKPDFGGAGALINHYGDVRARLRGRMDQPRAQVNKPGPVAPVTSPAAAPSPSPNNEPAVLRSIPLEIRDAVVNVADALAITPSALLSDLDSCASLGRRLAAALVVRRSRIPPRDAARHFGVAEALVESAVRTFDDVLAATQASAVHAPLAPLIRLAVEHWHRFEDQLQTSVSIAEIQEVVARVFRVSVNELKASRRSKDIIAPRHIAIYLAHRFTRRSMPEIGRAFLRDHSTVVHAVKKMRQHGDAVAAIMTPDASIQAWAQALRREMG